MESKMLSLALMLAVAIGGCNPEKKIAVPKTFSNVSIRTSYNPDAKIQAGGKYAFVQYASGVSSDSEVAMIDQRIMSSLSSELRRKGYKPGQYEELDFFVDYSLELQQTIDILVAKSKVQGNEWIAAVVAPNDYVNGALLVQIIDVKKMEPVWLGVFNSDVAMASVSEQEKQARVDYAVRELLKQFPPH
jgi:hypothetical protein